jgi:CRISPR/Cas system CMR subunit Cmr6 (Cas7 group RAMP superfamily)
VPDVHGVLHHLFARLGNALPSRDDDGHPLTEFNADLLLTRLWIGPDDVDLRTDHLRAVARACGDLPPGMLSALQARRTAAVAALVRRRGGDWTWRGLRVTPVWRVVIGHGESTAHETSLTMSPTYGVPVFPGTALKGVAAGYAALGETPVEPAELARLFGSPRPQQPAAAARGSVVVLDALPVTEPRVVVDVLTPHVKPYYDNASDPDQPTTVPPAEYHNPVPVRFLAVERPTSFRSLLAGPTDDVDRFVELLRAGLDEFGLGGKTAAGYGYCELTVEPPEQAR